EPRADLVGGFDETVARLSGRAARPDAASSVAPVPSRYEHSLRPCLGTSITPRGRGPFRQTLLAHIDRVDLLGLDRDHDPAVLRGVVRAEVGAVLLADFAGEGAVVVGLQAGAAAHLEVPV